MSIEVFPTFINDATNQGVERTKRPITCQCVEGVQVVTTAAVFVVAPMDGHTLAPNIALLSQPPNESLAVFQAFVSACERGRRGEQASLPEGMRILMFIQRCIVNHRHDIFTCT